MLHFTQNPETMKSYIILKKSLFFISFLWFTLPISAAINYLPDDTFELWEGGPAYYAKWTNGPSVDSTYFPIAIWYQSTKDAIAYKNIGINYFIHLGNAPTESQLITLKNQEQSAISIFTSTQFNSTNNNIVKAWMHPTDEPDNAVSGTQTPVLPGKIQSDYATLVAQDSTRPIYLQLGQGVASDLWYGRGDRTGHPEDYAEYAKGADIVSFDVYPMNVFPAAEGAATWKAAFCNELTQSIWYVAKGVDRLRQCTNYQKPVWVWLECTNFSGNSACVLTPTHTKAEVWMSIIHGARGIGYFCHTFSPYNQAGLLADTKMSDTLAIVHAQITAHAQILNTQTVSNAATLVSSNQNVPVDYMVKRHQGFTYVYAVSMRPGNTNATFTLRRFVGFSDVEVVGENRTISANNGVFQDTFSNYSVHIYKVATPYNTQGIDGIIQDDTEFKISGTSNPGEFVFESNRQIDYIEIYSMSGIKILSKQIDDNHGLINVPLCMKNLLLVRATMDDHIIIHKYINN